MTGRASCCFYGTSFQRSDQHMASKHVASISPLKYCGAQGEGGLPTPTGCLLCSPAEHLLCTNSSRPVPLANGTKHLVCKLVSYLGGCGLGTAAAGAMGRRMAQAWGQASSMGSGSGCGEVSLGRGLYAPEALCPHL